jgi:putative aldouronate transport system permease protein
VNSVPTAPVIIRREPFGAYLRRYWTLYLLLLLPVAYFVVFKYIPMAYISIAFKKYRLNTPLWAMPWADKHGFEYFIQAFSNKDFYTALRNTIGLNLLDIIIGFPAPIILAIVLNEIKQKTFKKFTQTVAYMPHFLSWIIIAGLALQVFAPNSGLINNVIRSMGFPPIPFLNEPIHWVITYIFLGVWQSIGWNTIIYLSAITAINPELYEAVAIDGGGRWRKIWHVTLPGIRSTIVTLFIIRLGYILGSEFDRPYSLANPLVHDAANVLSTFIFTNGIQSLRFSMTTAVGLFQSAVGVIFVLTADRLAKRFGERGIV